MIKLNKNDFEYKEWVALVYAREWAFTRGENVPNELKEEFVKNYSKQEQGLIMKVIHIKIFINYLVSLFKKPGKDESCNINS
jgi:hypothetical protein